MERKTILTLLLAIGMLSSFFSCKKNVDNTFFENYLYKNNSGHNIDVIAYYKSEQLQQAKYIILDKKEIILRQDISLSMIDSLIINADSVKIIFDSNKSVVYHKNDTSEYNIIDRRNYTSNEVSSNERDYDYEFKIEDYNQAE